MWPKLAWEKLQGDIWLSWLNPLLGDDPCPYEVQERGFAIVYRKEVAPEVSLPFRFEFDPFTHPYLFPRLGEVAKLKDLDPPTLEGILTQSCMVDAWLE